ncbi:hypothetical protein CYMTET_40769 [Cymbomonas tetramitiformis]|uniref:Uncharacterized protein n=1 Tax=Cymbomonas tetramitiformis TaxID=36881 RepID=A0AAE0F376_9CHLO|nr:hypothetical protein CYMTET_40769 [Cymbomonas tetramitiformis]
MSGVYGQRFVAPPDWMSLEMWKLIKKLSFQVPEFSGLDESLSKEPERWKRLATIESSYEHELKAAVPKEWWPVLTSFNMLLLLRCMRPELLLPLIKRVISSELDINVERTPVFNLLESYRLSKAVVPIIFVLHQSSADPTAQMQEFSKRMRRGLHTLSLGEHCAEAAQQLFNSFVGQNRWLLFQNCHLAHDWLPHLTAIVESLGEQGCHPEFRLWLTLVPSSEFPSSILLLSIKLIDTPPLGMKSKMQMCFQGVKQEDLLDSSEPLIWQRLLFATCWFHCLVLERQRFGPVGFNQPYDFGANDLQISRLQLKGFVDMIVDQAAFTTDKDVNLNPNVIKLMHFLWTESLYGGQVTDNMDMLVLETLVKQHLNAATALNQNVFVPIFNDNMENEELRGCPAGLTKGTHEKLITFLADISDEGANKPETFGLHQGDGRTLAERTVTSMLNDFLSIQLHGAYDTKHDGQDIYQAVPGIVRLIQNQLQQNILGLHEEDSNIWAKRKRELRMRAPFESNSKADKRDPRELLMEHLYLCEHYQYSELLRRVHASLERVLSACEGLNIMDKDTEEICISLYSGNVPAQWTKYAYPGHTALGSWVDDLEARLDFVVEWRDNGTPVVFPMEKLFNIDRMLTGVMQAHARRNGIKLDNVRFECRVLKEGEEPDKMPSHGIYISELHLHGAMWDKKLGLCDIEPSSAHINKLPVVWLCPVMGKEAVNTPLSMPARVTFKEQRRRERRASFLEIGEHSLLSDAGPRKQSPAVKENRYFCPIYRTSQRASHTVIGCQNTYIMSISLPTWEKPEKWISRGVAMICQITE